MDYSKIASQEQVEKVIAALATRGIEGVVVQTKEAALAKIKELIPSGVSVMNGSSRTLEEVGYVEYLKSGAHPWKNLHEEILKETDKAKQSRMRKEALLSDYYLGSVHALSEDGQFLIASNSGSQLPHVVFSSPNLIFVVGTHKIVPTLEDAMRRVEEYVLPLEDERMKSVGGSGSAISKLIVFRREPAFLGRKVYMILVPEKLGF